MRLAEANYILRLSDSQLAVVRRGAATLRPAARDKYLRIVADELAEVARVDDATVQSTVDDDAHDDRRNMKEPPWLKSTKFDRYGRVVECDVIPMRGSATRAADDAATACARSSGRWPRMPRRAASPVVDAFGALRVSALARAISSAGAGHARPCRAGHARSPAPRGARSICSTSSGCLERHQHQRPRSRARAQHRRRPHRCLPRPEI